MSTALMTVRDEPSMQMDYLDFGFIVSHGKTYEKMFQARQVPARAERITLYERQNGDFAYNTYDAVFVAIRSSGISGITTGQLKIFYDWAKDAELLDQAFLFGQNLPGVRVRLTTDNTVMALLKMLCGMYTRNLELLDDRNRQVKLTADLSARIRTLEEDNQGLTQRWLDTRHRLDDTTEELSRVRAELHAVRNWVRRMVVDCSIDISPIDAHSEATSKKEPLNPVDVAVSKSPVDVQMTA